MVLFDEPSKSSIMSTQEPSRSSSTRTSDVDDSVSGSAVLQKGDGDKSRKKRKKRRSKHGGADGMNGETHTTKKRRHSISKAARDPRDEPEGKHGKKPQVEEGTLTRSPSPVIDFDGLSRPSETCLVSCRSKS